MSILIKNVIIPKGCEACPIRNTRFCKCDTRRYTSYYLCDHRAADCPLIEVPTPHGDLIDMQVLLKDLFEGNCELSRYGRVAKYSEAIDEVRLALPVIKAEEK